MEKFNLVLKNDKLKQYDRMALVIILFQLLLFVYLAVYAEKEVRVAAIIASISVSLSLAVHFILASIKKNKDVPYLHAGLFLSTMGWILVGNLIGVIISFALESLYMLSRKPFTIQIFEDKIIYGSFPKKTVSWSQLSNLLLRDDILTMDFKNNKIIQAEVSYLEKDVKEEEFNEFCRKHVNGLIPAT